MGEPIAPFEPAAELTAKVHGVMQELLLHVQAGYHHPAGEYWVPNAPFQMPGLDIAAKPRVPELGEDTAEVLGSLLGYSPQQAAACGGARSAH